MRNLIKTKNTKQKTSLVTCSVIASESDSLQPGVMLTADKKGDSILLRNKLSGEFSFNFEPITVNKVVTTKIFDTTLQVKLAIALRLE